MIRLINVYTFVVACSNVTTLLMLTRALKTAYAILPRNSRELLSPHIRKGNESIDLVGVIVVNYLSRNRLSSAAGYVKSRARKHSVKIRRVIFED